MGWLNFFSDSENWDLAGTFYHIDAMHAGNQLNRSERFTCQFVIYFPYTKVSKLNCNLITEITYENSDAVTGQIDKIWVYILGNFSNGG